MPYIYENREVKEYKNVRVGATCDRCEMSIPMTAPGGYGFTDAITITASGGYGEYIDGMGNIVLCGNCAKEIEDSVPVIAKLFNIARDYD